MFEVINVYQVTTHDNQPNIKKGDYVITSNLPKVKHSDFLLVNVAHETFGSYKTLLRLVGLPSDTLQIKNGTVYVNQKNIDDALRLKHAYSVNNKVLRQILLAENQRPTQAQPLSDSTHLVYMEDPLALAYEKEVKRLIEPKNDINDFIQLTYNKPWNKDQFGPVVLSKNQYFVLGDHRDKASDSRVFGIIDKENIVAVALNK